MGACGCQSDQWAEDLTLGPHCTPVTQMLVPMILGLAWGPTGELVANWGTLILILRN